MRWACFGSIPVPAWSLLEASGAATWISNRAVIGRDEPGRAWEDGDGDGWLGYTWFRSEEGIHAHRTAARTGNGWVHG